MRVHFFRISPAPEQHWNGDSARGFRVLVPPPYTSSHVVGFLGAGELQLEQGSTEPGATLSGRLQSTIYGTD